MTEQRVSPFANGSEYMMWMELNCYRCKKYDENKADVEVCAIDYEVGLASISDGTIPHEIAQRMGRLDHPVNEIFQCHEFESESDLDEFIEESQIFITEMVIEEEEEGDR